ncbi:asparagine synthase-related protein, partial [Acinetobacter baumannii]
DGVAATGIANRLDEDDETVVERFHHLIADAVKRRMVADVPLGAFLSGGIDSSTVVALMQAQSAARVKTFTIAWEDAQYSEAA